MFTDCKGLIQEKLPFTMPSKLLKALCFFLPLDLQNTLERLDEAGYTSNSTGLPDPELYIIIDSCPTKYKIDWQSLVDVPRVKLVTQKLQETNWLFGLINLACIDDAATVDAAKVVDSVDAAEKTMGIDNDVTSHVIAKASDKDMAGLQAMYDQWTKIYLEVKTFSITSCLQSMNFQWIIVCTFLISHTIS